MMHMSDEIPLPSAANPRVPPAIDKVVLTALGKKKADRFPSMRDMHRALAQARNAVEDTPAPVTTTDPHMPSVVLGVDALAKPAAGAGTPGPTRTPAPALNDAAAGEQALHARTQRLVRYALIGGGVLVAALGFTLALRHPPSPPAPAATTAAVPPPVSPPTIPALTTSRETGATPAAAEIDDGTAQVPTAAKTAPTDGKPAAPKLKTAAKSHHRTPKRKDPVKW
jgi:serine/threonine-protein kinase